MKAWTGILLALAWAAVSPGCMSQGAPDQPPRPVLLDVSETAQPGEALNLHGAYLSADAVAWVVTVEAGSPDAAERPRELEILNRSSFLIQARAPQDLKPGLWRVWLQERNVQSNAKFVNRARGVCFDTPEVAPGGTFRIWGHNLSSLGAASAVTFTDCAQTPLRATVVQADAWHLTVRAPTALVPGTKYRVQISNGLGGRAGETEVAEALQIRTAGPDAWGLGVAWAADLTYSGNVYNVHTDARLSLHAVGDGIHDDLPALRAALSQASRSSQGGGVVYLPAGVYFLDNSRNGISIYTHVTLKGDGMGKTILQYGRNDNPKAWGIEFHDAELSGLLDLTVENLNPNSEANASVVEHWSGVKSRLFFKRVEYRMGNGLQIMMPDVDRLAVEDCRIDATGEFHGWAWLKGCRYLTFRGNDIVYHAGRGVFSATDHGVIEDNVFTLEQPGTGPRYSENGGPELSFSRDVIVTGNTIQVSGTADTTHNDGEALLTQNSITPDFRDVGTLTASGSATVQDTAKDWSQITTFVPRSIVAITGGPALGQWRTIVAHTANTLTLDRPWEVVPPPGSSYTITSWATNQMFVLGNTFQNNFKGIEFYEGAWDCVVAGNTLTDSDGITLRAVDRTVEPGTPSYGKPGYRREIRHDPVWNNLVVGNTVSNPNRRQVAAIAVALFQIWGPLHGNAVLGTEVRGNTIVSSAPSPTATSQTNNVNQDGYWTLLLKAPETRMPHDDQAETEGAGFLGSIFEDNQAKNMGREAYRVSEGASQIVIRPKSGREK